MTIKEEYLVSLGEIVVDFNALESAIEFLIWEYVTGGNQDLGRRVTYKLGFKEKLDLLQGSIFEREGEQAAEKFKIDLYNRIKDAGEIRNEYLHSNWHIDCRVNGAPPEEGSTLRINYQHAAKESSRKAWDWQKGFRAISLKELKDFSTELLFLRAKVFIWLNPDDRNKEPDVSKVVI